MESARVMATPKKGKKASSRPSSRKRGYLWGALLVLLGGGAAWWWGSPSQPIPPSVAIDEQAGGAGPGPRDVTPAYQKEVFARYAGTATCRECHPEAYVAWTRSHHALAERPLIAELDRAAFEPERSFTHGSQETRVWASNDVYHVQAKGLSGQPETYQVQRVIGHDPLRQFLVAAPGARLQTLEATWDPHRQEWFNVYGEEDRQPGEWGHWTGRGMTWNSMCASCHNTRLYKNYHETGDRYETVMAEPSVGCEACHGPMRQHVEWRLANPHSTQPDPGLVPWDRSVAMDTCGTCHARRYELTGDFQPGDDFDDHFVLTVVDGTDLYYPDGQVRDENYEYASFLGSRMHAAGVTCLDCHHPHQAKPILEGDLLCMRCHTGEFPNSPVIDPAGHSFHKVGEPGGRCIDCHMPITVYMQRHPRHDHGFTIPDPLLTKEFGIPNACNRCHVDKDANWTLEAVERWYGPKMERPSRARARWVSQARQGDGQARLPLMTLLQGEETPYWKAVAANLLDIWAAEPDVTRLLIETLQHTNALVRQNAAHSLGPLLEAGQFPEVAAALRQRLADPVRSVRYQAAWALRPFIDPNSQVGREMTWALELNGDFPSGQMQKGAFALAQNRPEEALPHYQRAVQWDPYSPALRHDFGVVLSMVGRAQEALEEMLQACRLAPNEAEYHFKLGLAFNEIGDPDQTVAALAKTVQLDPRHARAWYNLGLAYHRRGEPQLALDVLMQGETFNPGQAMIPYVQATILIQLGRFEEARQAARRALEVQPSFPAAEELLRSIP